MDKTLTARQCRQALSERSASLFLVLLLCGDLVYVVLHVLNTFTPMFNNDRLSLEADRGYPEMYQYLKLAWIVLLLISASFRAASAHYVAWALLFAYFLLDDSWGIHERSGLYFAANLEFTPPLGLRREDYGELAASAAAGILLLPLVLWAYRSGSQVFRKVSKDFILLLLVLVFFGVAADMAHIATRLGWTASFILGVVDDGGEMISISLVLWYTFLLNVRDDGPGCYLCDWVRGIATGRST